MAKTAKTQTVAWTCPGCETAQRRSTTKPHQCTRCGEYGFDPALATPEPTLEERTVDPTAPGYVPLFTGFDDDPDCVDCAPTEEEFAAALASGARVGYEIPFWPDDRLPEPVIRAQHEIEQQQGAAGKRPAKKAAAKRTAKRKR